MKTKKQPFKITIKQHGHKCSIKAPDSDIEFTEYLDILRQISLAAGWSTGLVKEFFDE